MCRTTTTLWAPYVMRSNRSLKRSGISNKRCACIRQAASSYGLAKIHKQQGHYAAALEELRAAGAVDPNSASVYYLRAQNLLAMGLRQEAKTEFAKAASCAKLPATSWSAK